MMAIAAAPPILRVSLAADGRMLRADEPVAALQEEAGGAQDGPLAVPQLAAIARLAARLGIVVSRPVVAATAVRDIDMWVRAKPDGDGVEITIIDWRERPRTAAIVADHMRSLDLTASGEGWGWQVDAQLRFVAVADDAGKAPSPAPDIGGRFLGYFHLAADADGDLPVLEAFNQRRAFDGQRATLTHDRASSVLLSGFPLFDMAGQFSGYRGKAVMVARDALDPDPVVEDLGVDFGRRLDRSLRQPLGRIIANADTISAQRDGPLRPDYAGYASDIAVAGRHLLALIDDLADLQAIDRPDFSVAHEAVDLADLARRAAGLLGVKAIDRRITISTPDAQDSAVALGEFRRVLQILVNLIGNAVRYAPDGSQIWVRVERGADYVGVSVADQGPGIAADAQERIFDKFERLGRDEAGGSGLGLYISRQLARAMGGDIRVESAPGEGARFILTMPADLE